MKNSFESAPGVDQIANELVVMFTHKQEELEKSEREETLAGQAEDEIRQFWEESVPESLQPAVLEQLKKMGRNDVAELFEHSKV